MQIVFVVVLALHALSAVFWAGTTFAIARSQGQGLQALRLRQRGASIGAIVTGILLWGLAHRGGAGRYEIVLGVGALAALAAAALQFTSDRAGPAAEGERTSRMLRAQQRSAGLLALALLCMVLGRYAA
ncbi:MAG: hypothetical protein ACJ8G7_18400 [Rhizobacter sp.]